MANIRGQVEDRAIVVVEQCWGCNRLRGPKKWAGWWPVLKAEGRLRYREYMCSNGPAGICEQALAVLDPDNAQNRTKRKRRKSTT